ncbi:M23 family metallopeptidase [Pseudoxanthomonas suwonensis]|uniref:M23 family metallopeptidase n=1 Tax=Pseudoxanthomonas suwonensis TaxID=314722 RepID=UPI0004B066EC|nr:M23 family metallopeptidase [Pseudoxanthomonas suwonensis]
MKAGAPRRVATALVALALAAPVEAASRFWPAPGTKEPPAAPGASQPAPTGEAVRLQLSDRGSHYEVAVRNHAPGPMQVRLALARASNLRAVPALPLEAVLPPGAQRVLARLYPLDPRQEARFDLDLRQLPGDPRARPADIEYRLPFDHQQVRVDQAFGGRFSHADAENHYAVDFAMPEGTPVLAARGGTVLQVQAGFRGNGQDRADLQRANYVRLLHDDGSMALYAHLQAASVTTGERVRQGQRIGLSGNTGFSTAPHLHFAVQVNAGMALRAIPFRMAGPQGELQFAREDAPAPPAGAGLP